MKSKKIEVTEIAIADLVSDDKNANMHTEAGDKLTYKSISELGLLRSGGVDANNMLIAGNGVKKQALLAGKTKALIVDIDEDTWVVTRRKDLDLNDPGESGRKARQMALVDNASALAGIEFDIEAVQEIEEKWGFEAVDWGVEFPEEEKEVPAAEEDEGAGALPSHPVTVKGDVWELISEGKKLRHRVMCGDSTDSDAVGSLMGGQKADFVFTSPPYNTGGFHADAAQGSSDFKAYPYLSSDDAKSQEDYLQMNRDIFGSIQMVTTDNANILYNISYNQNSPYEYVLIIADAIRSGLKLHETIIWKKTSATPLRSRLTRIVEFIFLLSKNTDPNPPTNQEFEETKYNFWEVSNSNSQSKIHGAAFPVELPAKGIIDFCVGKNVFEPFTGSGTTLIACEQLNRNCYGMELDEKYCDVIVRRWIAQMEKDGAKWKVLLNGEERADMVAKLLEQGN